MSVNNIDKNLWEGKVEAIETGAADYGEDNKNRLNGTCNIDGVNKSNYYQVKEELANHLIEEFEEAFHIDIKEYIEEMEIATPFTIERYTNSINGCMFGPMRLGYDNSIHRLLSYNEEKIPHLSFVGASSLFGSGVDNAFYSGYYITEKLLEAERKDS